MAYKGDNLMSVKRGNRSAALRILHEKGAMSRKRLAENMKLTPAAITKIVGEMIGEGLLYEGEMLSSGSAGRREILINLNADAGVALGVFINLRQAILSAIRLDGSEIFSEELPLEEKADADRLVTELSALLLRRLDENGVDRSRVIGAGIAVRGICSLDGRVSVNSYGAMLQQDYPLCQRFEEALGVRCVMANNVRALHAAQMFCAKEEDGASQFFLRCEYGIGASLSIDGKIWQGVTGQSAEIGHIPVILRGGKPCRCGKSGCLETIASPDAVLEDAGAVFSAEKTPLLWKLNHGAAPDLELVFSAAQNGDAAVAAIVDRAVTTLSQALKAVIYLIHPEKIVLYGRMFENDYFVTRLLSEMREGVDSAHEVKIEISRYNRQLETKAAGLLAVREFFVEGGIQYEDAS